MLRCAMSMPLLPRAYHVKYVSKYAVVMKSNQQFAFTYQQDTCSLVTAPFRRSCSMDSSCAAVAALRDVREVGPASRRLHRSRDLDVLPQPPCRGVVQGRRSGTQLVDDLAQGKREIGRCSSSSSSSSSSSAEGEVNGNSCGGGDNSAGSAAAASHATNVVAEEARGEDIWWSEQGCCSFLRVQVRVGPTVQELK